LLRNSQPNKMLNPRTLRRDFKLRCCFCVFETSMRGRVTAANQTWRLCLQLSVEFERLVLQHSEFAV